MIQNHGKIMGKSWEIMENHGKLWEILLGVTRPCRHLNGMWHLFHMYLNTIITIFPGTVVELIEGGAEPDVADKYGTSALVWACRKGHYNVVHILLGKGVDCNSAGTHGWTPLIMSAKG